MESDTPVNVKIRLADGQHVLYSLFDWAIALALSRLGFKAESGGISHESTVKKTRRIALRN